VPFLLAPGPRGGGMKGAYVTIYDIASIPRCFRGSKLIHLSGHEEGFKSLREIMNLGKIQADTIVDCSSYE
jgi:hypothetical protein